MKNPKLKSKIEVKMGEGVITRAPHTISSLGLGSCVAVILYDTQQRIGGMAHIMLPDSGSLNGSQPSYKCADTAIVTLIQGLLDRGAARRYLVAKIAGGARMFANYGKLDNGIGAQNIMTIKRIMKAERIRLIGQDTGGHHGRSIQFHLDSGKVLVTAIGKQTKEI
ncbi:chemotaxis protein CheD [bacterium]|nr:MAG: chemotaxis protein CheD [bacterium]